MSSSSAGRPNDRGLTVVPGTPVYDREGEMMGRVSDYGIQWPHLIMQKGHIFHREVYIPVDAIVRSDDAGVHLSLTRKQVHDLVGGWSALGDVDLNTGTPADTPVADAEPHAETDIQSSDRTP